MKHRQIREGDEYTCTCGLRWGIDENDPHQPATAMKRSYKATAEQYINGKYVGVRSFDVEAVHCSVAASMVEKYESRFYAVDVQRCS